MTLTLRIASSLRKGFFRLKTPTLLDVFSSGTVYFFEMIVSRLFSVSRVFPVCGTPAAVSFVVLIV